MNRDVVYRHLLARMEEVRALGYDDLLPLVKQTVISEPVQIDNGEVWIDVVIVWADARHRRLYVWGTASGPNSWRMERIDEKVLVAPAA